MKRAAIVAAVLLGIVAVCVLLASDFPIADESPHRMRELAQLTIALQLSVDSPLPPRLAVCAGKPARVQANRIPPGTATRVRG